MDAQTKALKHYLNNMRFRPGQVRGPLFKFLIPFTVLFQLPIAIADPFYNLCTYLMLPLLVVLILFAIWISINPYKRQLETALYIGLLGTGVSLGFFLAAQKVAYGILHASTPLFFILTALGYVGWAFSLLRWHLKRLQSGLYRKSAQKPTGSGQMTKMLATGLGGLGVAVGLFMKFGNMEIRSILFSMAVYALSLLFAFFVILFHQYKLIRQHRDLVELEKPLPLKRNHKRKEA